MITEVVTDWNGFWRSSQWRADPNNPAKKPNSNHNLLAFTVKSTDAFGNDVFTTYSTGVNDDLLDDELGASNYSKQVFKAYSTNGIGGTTSSSNRYIVPDDLDGIIEGTAAETGVPGAIDGLSAYDVFIDGINGLNLATGIADFNRNADVSFYSGNGRVGGLDGTIPDLLITQLAKAREDRPDIYYYADSNGDIVGRPVELRIDRSINMENNKELS